MLRSKQRQIFISKDWPLIFSFGLTAFVIWKIGFRCAELLFLVPLFLLSLFRLTLAVVETSDEAFRYSRLSGWRTLQFDEITSCGFSKVGLEIGYIGLKRVVWPWGKLYFIMDEPLPGGINLVTFIRQHMETARAFQRFQLITGLP